LLSSSSKSDIATDSEQQQLATAFAYFNDTSEQLIRSYRELEGRVQQLTDELAQVSAEKAEADDQQAETATRMQALLDVLPAGVIVLDNRGVIVESNPAAENLLQIPLQGRVWRKVISECFAPRNDDGLEVSTKSGRRVGLATSSLDTQKAGEQGGQIVLLTDLTETRKLQQHVSRSERLTAMGKMVSALAHQIRTPLSAAILYADHLCNNALPAEKQHDFSQKLYRRLQHMERQVRDMLLFVKSELPLNDVLSGADLESELRDAAEAALSSSGSTCQWQNRASSVQLKCHREALVSALMNIINNGIQACENPAALTVTFSVSDNKYLHIDIQDSGPGMPAEMLEHAREIFVTSKPQGTGLGLAVVQSVVRAHGGFFELFSPPGEGLTVSLHIPVFNSTGESNYPGVNHESPN